MEAYLVAVVVGVVLPAFAFGWIVGCASQRNHNRRMSDIDKAKRAICWPVDQQK